MKVIVKNASFQKFCIVGSFTEKIIGENNGYPIVIAGTIKKVDAILWNKKYSVRGDVNRVKIHVVGGASALYPNNMVKVSSMWSCYDIFMLSV